MTQSPLRNRPPVFESVMGGAGSAFALWAGFYIIWAVGEVASRYGLAIPALIAMTSFGALGGLFWALNWDRIR